MTARRRILATAPRRVDRRLADPVAESVRASHAAALDEFGRRPAMKVVRNVALPSGTPVSVAHRLGTFPSWVGLSAVRGTTTPGSIVDLGAVDAAGRPIDRNQTVQLVATGFGQEIAVDVLFVYDPGSVTR